MGANTFLTVNPHVYKLPFDVDKDLQPVVLLACADKTKLARAVAAVRLDVEELPAVLDPVAALAGGADALLAHARDAFAAGDYRWVVEVVNHLVFADPANTEARDLQADALEQLGYQAESATFRNAYLMGAQELRNGTLPRGPGRRGGVLAAMSVDQIFDTLAVSLRSEDVGGLTATINFVVTDTGEEWVLGLSNRTLHAVAGRTAPDADLTLRLTRPVLLALADRDITVADAIAAGTATASGDPTAADRIFANLDTFMTNFPIVEP